MPALNTGDADKKKAGDWFVIKIVVFAKKLFILSIIEKMHIS